MEIIKLSNRLAAIAGFIEDGASVADVGTDHGYLPVYLAQTGRFSTIIASDIGSGPLQSARRSAIEYGVAERIVFVQAPGLTGLREGDADTIVLAGMGGDTIIEILSEAQWVKSGRVILQPQTKADELYEWLCGNGLAVSDAALACDAGRYYVILLATASGTAYNTDILSLLREKRDPLLIDYAGTLIKKTRRILDGMRHSKTEPDDRLLMQVKLERLIALIKEAENW